MIPSLLSREGLDAAVSSRAETDGSRVAGAAGRPFRSRPAGDMIGLCTHTVSPKHRVASIAALEGQGIAMDTKERIENQLKLIRGISEQMLSVFTTPEEWTHRVHDRANHPLWFAGHVGSVDDFLMTAVAPERNSVPDGYREKFGMGSRPTSDPADYPPVEEVLAFWRGRRTALLEVLAGLTEEDLPKPCPEGVPEIMTDVASLFEAAVWHEAVHLGQVTVARRHLGHPPMVDR